MTIEHIVDGLRLLLVAGQSPIESGKTQVRFAETYLEKHSDEFRRIARESGNLNPFYQRQDHCFYKCALQYAYKTERLKT